MPSRQPPTDPARRIPISRAATPAHGASHSLLPRRAARPTESAHVPPGLFPHGLVGAPSTRGQQVRLRRGGGSTLSLCCSPEGLQSTNTQQRAARLQWDDPIRAHGSVHDGQQKSDAGHDSVTGGIVKRIVLFCVHYLTQQMIRFQAASLLCLGPGVNFRGPRQGQTQPRWDPEIAKLCRRRHAAALGPCAGVELTYALHPHPASPCALASASALQHADGSAVAGPPQQAEAG